ncbi:MAG TPA: sigma-70 family RNA polymerase sigma factor [Candidatus Sulfotelmatobacter sp.]|jgi:RNA polymerase sigma-70 factor, ECF subfamily|nr:sigma-70 family RNA polymerase sigma factor [Candidatus Sulfotelmatobacter sp.]
MKSFSGTVIDKNSDAELVAATKHGDSQAFEELVLRHKRRVLSVAKRITNNWEDAEDVAQESFHKAFLHLDSFQEKARFSTWLTRITMNEALMLLRRKRGVFEALPESPENGATPTLEPFVDRSPNPEESCWRREHKQLLSKAINRLGPKVRRTILLRDIEERSVQETARIMGISISAVKARVFQGRRRLRQTVNPALLIGFCAPDPGAAQRF